MKLSWVSKLKPPVQKEAEPDEMELDAQYRYFKRRNKIAHAIRFGGAMTGVSGGLTFLIMGDYLNFAINMTLLGVATTAFFGAAKVNTLSGDEQEQKMKPVADMGDKEKSEALRLIRHIPKARELSDRVLASGRALRGVHLEAMRELETQRDAKRLKREAHRLGVETKSDEPRLGPRVN